MAEARQLGLGDLGRCRTVLAERRLNEYKKAGEPSFSPCREPPQTLQVGLIIEPVLPTDCALGINIAGPT